MDPSPSGRPEPVAVFVYGTLMPGHLRWPMLDGHATGWQAAEVPGRLYDTGQGWPAAAVDPVPTDGTTVPGALVRLDPDVADVVLAVLDEAEGVPDLFDRVAVTTTTGEGAWAWVWPHDVAGWPAIERWSEQRES